MFKSGISRFKTMRASWSYVFIVFMLILFSGSTYAEKTQPSLKNFLGEGRFQLAKFDEVERQWIKDNPTIVLGVDPYWAPFEQLDDDGVYVGMAADYMQLVAKISGLKITVQDNPTWSDVIKSAKAGNLDVLPAVMRSADREQYLSFTTPHISYPMVILTDRDARFLSGLDDLVGSRVAVIKDYVTEEILRENHPEIKLVLADNIFDALEMLSSGTVDAYLDNLATIALAISELGSTNLRISGSTKYDFSLSIAVPREKKILSSIMQKSLDAIHPKQRDAIKKRWIVVDYNKRVDYSLSFQIFGVTAFLMLVVIAWNRRLSGEIKSRKIAEEKARMSEESFRMLFEDKREVELIINPDDGTIIEANRAAANYYGYSRECLRSMKVFEINVLSEQEASAEMQLAKKEERTHFYFRHQLSNGDIRDVEVHTGPVLWDGEQRLYSIIHDITHEKHLQDELEEKNKRLSFQATHDDLTGLINRREFEVRLERVIKSCSQKTVISDCTLIFMDLDQFKIVNDTAGHAAGDELLRRVGKLLQSFVRDRDTLARLGGDEFGLILQNCSIVKSVEIAQKIILGVKEIQFLWEGASFHIGISMGLTSIIPDEKNLDEILSDADAACYVAKQRGRNGFHIYSQENEALLKHKGEMNWGNEIARAIEEDRFVLYRQLIKPVNCSDNKGLHYEVLLRMLDENGEVVPPNNFLPSAERYKLMPVIDRWVVDHVLVQLANNPVELEKLDQCCINLSGQSIGDEKFTRELFEKIESSVIPANKFCWEITETAAILNFNEAQVFISALKSLGCTFALDDFGSGLSSFSYLKHLEVDYLKIDGSFVVDMLNEPKDALIVESIHRVGSGLQMKTIAEFVENQQIMDKLTELGVDYAQGYHLGRPEPFNESTF